MRAKPLCVRFSALASCAVAGIMAFTLMMPLPAHAATAAELQAAASATLDKLQTLQQKLDEASTEYQDALDAQQAAKEKKEEAQAKIGEANEQIADLQDKLGTRARGMYRSGALSILDVLTSSASFKDFTNNWDILNEMNQSDADMVQETKDLRAVVEEQEKEAAEQERVETEKAAVAEQVKNEAESLVSEAEATYNALSAEAAQALEAERQARNAENLRVAQANLASGGASGGSGGINYYNGSASYSAGNAVGNAYSMLGSPYVWGGAAPGGFDCSGFVGWCLSGGRQGTDRYYASWPQTNDPQPGDVCVRDGHVGLYIGNGQMIHASDYGVGVIQSAVEPGMTYHRG